MTTPTEEEAGIEDAKVAAAEEYVTHVTHTPETEIFFKGDTHGLKGNFFQCFGKSPDKQKFTSTIKALTGYISPSIDFPKGVASNCKKMELDIIQEPVDLAKEEGKSATKKFIWKTKVQTYARRVET